MQSQLSGSWLPDNELEINCALQIAVLFPYNSALLETQVYRNQQLLYIMDGLIIQSETATVKAK